MSDIKYRHPFNHDLTWSGKGRQPKWVEHALTNDLTIEQLDVANQHMAADQTAEIDLGISGLTDPDLDVVRPRAEAVPAFPLSGEVVGEQGIAADIEQIQLSEWIGQRKFSAALQKLLTVSDLVELQKMKDSKAYKGLLVIGPEGKPLTVSSFGDLCDAIGGSEPHINEQLLNLRTFGSEFLQFADQSIGFREMRALRKLPSDQREALAQIAVTGNKEDVLEAAYEAIEQERNKRSELEVKAAELGEDLKLAERRAKNLDAECERKDMQIKRLSSSKARCTEFLERTEDIRSECLALQAEAELPLAALKKLFDEINDEDASLPEQRVQLEHVWMTAHVVFARALSMIEHLHDTVPCPMPDRINGTHIMSPAEAQRWLLDYPMIENRHAAEAATRQEKREAAKPKGPGRPKGSGNKAGTEE